MQKKRVVIIGSGPAGFAAALYTARAQLKPVLIAGNALGGQVSQTHEIENYLGFESLSGMELVQKFQSHVEHFGAQVVYDAVTEVDFTKGSPFTVKTHGETYLADTVIVTIGADPRKLKVPGEAEYIGRGVSYCGTCDGFFFRGKDVVVVGGGDSALEESLFLTRFANSVNIIHRRDTLRAGVQLQSRAKKNEKISFTWNTVVEEILGGDDGSVRAVRLKNVQTGEVYEKPTDGVFIFIGHVPNSQIFAGQLATNDNGYIITDQRYRTNVDGVFAAGEIQDEIWRQVITSAGQGAAAGMSAIHWLEEHEDELQPLEEAVQET
ncbi:MAG: thioredoxin-disulfide reductase [Phototrophicales bacterium]|nr:MAG: thioredoxin-disulfide reductase [Phototrophicales bacterium]RMG77713.1 MAG: thioredoxin-disulfide reductase [Chloroflexota bacterium]